MLDSLEAGKPITDCRDVDLPETVKTFRWYAEAIDKVFDAVAPTGPEALGPDRPRADRRRRRGRALELPDPHGRPGRSRRRSPPGNT